MPIPILLEAFTKGFSSVPLLVNILRYLPWILCLAGLKYYFGGARNTSERLLHSKVIMITGGTSGIGAAVVRSLASRGAQIIILTQHSPTDLFLSEYIDDLRRDTSNELIYAEQVDLASLHSIRVFATKWVDNAPPRRLDMIILCAATMTPRFSAPIYTKDDLEPCWGINYLANFHLLSILSPALRAQPADRDVRIVIATCASYTGGDLVVMRADKRPLPQGREYETSKLALMVFARTFQSHLDDYARPDKQPNNARVVLVDPGRVRTPGTRRWLTLGTLWGLLFYLLTWPLYWLVLKSPEMGAQGFLTAVMEAELGRGMGGKFLRECRLQKIHRKELDDDKISKELWRFSENQVTVLEKEGAVRRAERKRAGNGENNKAQRGTAEGQPGSTPTAASSGMESKISNSRSSKRIISKQIVEALVPQPE